MVKPFRKLSNNLNRRCIMPKLDGKGPEGNGSGTGRKMGNCNISTEEEKLKNTWNGHG